MALSKTNKKKVKTMSVAEQIEMLNKEAAELKKENEKTAREIFIIQKEIEMQIIADRERIEMQIIADKERIEKQIIADREQLKEQIKADRENLEKQIKADREETKKQMKELNKQMGGIGLSMGQLIENFFVGSIKSKLKEIGVKNIDYCVPNQPIILKHFETEVDCWITGQYNGKETIFLCECKTFLKKDHIITLEQNTNKILEFLSGAFKKDGQCNLIFGYNKIDEEAKLYAKSKKLSALYYIG